MADKRGATAIDVWLLSAADCASFHLTSWKEYRDVVDCNEEAAEHGRDLARGSGAFERRVPGEAPGGRDGEGPLHGFRRRRRSRGGAADGRLDPRRQPRHPRRRAERAPTVVGLLRRPALPGDDVRIDQRRALRRRCACHSRRADDQTDHTADRAIGTYRGRKVGLDGRERIAFELRGSLNRQDYDLGRNHVLESGLVVGNTIELVLEVIADSEAPLERAG